jgi:autotransporter-associated beta strand protein
LNSHRYDACTTSSLACWIASGAILCGAATAAAQDQLSSLYGTANLAAFAYDPTTDILFTTAYGNPAMTKVTGLDGTPTSTLMVSETILQLYYRNNDPTRGVATPTQGGILLNPKPVGTAPAYSFALVADGGFTRFPASSTVDPAATKKIYAYNLQVASITGDGTDVFTTRTTLADMQAASGATSTSNTMGRQFAWSGDGQSIYFVDSSPAYDGLWKVGAVAGAPQRILDADMGNTEPGVYATGGVDRIHFAGLSGATNNAGGIDFVTHDGATTSSPQVAVSVTKLLDFFEVPSLLSSQRVSSVAFAGSDMYFAFFNTNSNASQRLQGIYRMDAAGRISKVANRTERTAAFGLGVGQTFDRFQPREIAYSGTAGSFPVTQVLYRETGANTVAGAIAFKPGDFNRDDAVTSADIALFKPQVTASGTANVKTNVADLKFDMNGNDIVSWKDVQILEQFLDYVPDPTLAGWVIPELTIKADTNLDGLVDFADFRIMRDNYAPAAGNRTFLVGDSSGDDRVDFADLQPWVNSDGYRSAVIGVGVPTTPFNKVEFDAFLATLTPPNVVLDVASGTSTQFEKGYRSIVIAASVTKTGSGAVVFDGVNTYSGTTTVAAGSLIVDPAGTFGTSPLVDVRAEATLDVSRVAGGLTVANGQTLGGSGTVVGSVVFGRGATLSPGAMSTVSSLQDGLAQLSVGSFSTAVAVVPEPASSVLAALAALVGVGAAACRRLKRD